MMIRLARYLCVFFQLGITGLGALLLAPAAVAATPAASPEATQGRRIDSAAGFVVLPSHERVEPENRILTERLEHLLPALMSEAGMETQRL